jgi:hypothetical protein
VDTVRANFVHSPRKSTGRGARQLNMPHTTVHKILRKGLKFKSYKYQLLQHVTAEDKEVRYTFSSVFLSRIEGDELVTAKTVFSDEATFHSSGNDNRHNLRIWGSNGRPEVIEHMRQSKVESVMCFVQTKCVRVFLPKVL